MPIEFPPHNGGTLLTGPEPDLNQSFRGTLYSYRQTVLSYACRPMPAHSWATIPVWDNTPRRQDDGVVCVDSTPGAYQAWLESILRQTRELRWGDEKLVFVNTWDECAEVACLERDNGWGHGYLEATRRAIARTRLGLG